MMNFLNKKLIGRGIIAGIILLPIIFYSQKSLAVVDPTSFDASASSAQTENALNNSISFFLTTGNTIPNAPLRVSATSYSFDLNSSDILWRVNGKVFKRGTGEKSIEIMLGDAGSSTKVEIDASILSGQTYHKEIIIIPAAVDLLWQAQTYTPVWYKGKPLPSSTSMVKVIAIPYFKTTEGKLIPATDLTYKWSLNYKVLSSSSGYGKSSMRVEMPQLMHEAKIKVEVSTRDGSIVRTSFLSLRAEETKTLLYENHPTKGVGYGSALSKKTEMTDSTFNLKVEPFFFALRDLRNIIYNWSANGKKIEGTEKINNIVFTREDGDRGSSSISVETKNARDFLQTAQGNLLIDFDN